MKSRVFSAGCERAFTEARCGEVEEEGADVVMRMAGGAEASSKASSAACALASSSSSSSSAPSSPSSPEPSPCSSLARAAAALELSAACC